MHPSIFQQMELQEWPCRCVALETQATQKHDQTVGPSSYSGSTYIAWQLPAIQLYRLLFF